MNFNTALTELRIGQLNTPERERADAADAVFSDVDPHPYVSGMVKLRKLHPDVTRTQDLRWLAAGHPIELTLAERICVTSIARWASSERGPRL